MDIVDEMLVGVAEPPVTLIVVSPDPREGAVVLTGEAKIGTLANLGGEEIKVDVHTGGNPKLHP